MAFGQDNCTAPNPGGAALNSEGAYMTMVVVGGWKRTDSMGKTSNWRVDRTDGSSLDVSLATLVNGSDAPSIAAALAHRAPGSLNTCTVAGEKAYLVPIANASTVTGYRLYLQHAASPPLQVSIDPGSGVPLAAVIRDVKAMLGSWVWVSP